MRAIARRDWLVRTAAAGAALAAPRGATCAASLVRVRGANDSIGVAVVGFRGHGNSHIRAYEALEGVRVAALCDADRDVLESGTRRLARGGEKVRAYVDVRKLLEDREVDAVSTATPNHWHALLAVWACQAGKDVCVEKPVSHGIWEGRKMVQAARKYGRVVQAFSPGPSSGT